MNNSFNQHLLTIHNYLHYKYFFQFEDAKTSDQRATIPYLLQEMCTDYDKQDSTMKQRLDMASNTGFHGSRFILDRNHQLCLLCLHFCLILSNPKPWGLGQNMGVNYVPISNTTSQNITQMSLS